MFKNGKLYRHNNTLDIDMYVFEILNQNYDASTLKVKWWNRNSKIFQPDKSHFEVITVKNMDIDMWKEV